VAKMEKDNPSVDKNVEQLSYTTGELSYTTGGSTNGYKCPNVQMSINRKMNKLWYSHKQNTKQQWK